MKKYKVKVRVRGCIARPSYEGTVSVYSDEPEPDLQLLVYQRLSMTTFQDWLFLDDVIIRSVVGES